MEMHPLASAPHSFKELVIHIGIVTVGILIALSLDGCREAVHEHRLVRETREKFHSEISDDRQNMQLELQNIHHMSQATEQIIVALPDLEHNPDQLKARVRELKPSLYFFRSSSWIGAVSSGALSHMDTDEVTRYADFDFVVREYSNMEDRALTQQLDLQSYVDSRRTFGPSEMEEIDQKLRNFAMLYQMMDHVGQQAAEVFQSALSH